MNVAGAVVATLLSAALMASLASPARDAAIEKLLVHGYPKLATTGEDVVQIRVMTWADGKQMRFRDSDDQSQVILLADGWGAVISPGPIEMRHDESCGIDCTRALAADGIGCSTPMQFGLISDSAACRMHIWSDAEGNPTCFFELREEVHMVQTVKIPGVEFRPPSQLPFECPASMGWLER